jgi:hypothetical protein
MYFLKTWVLSALQASHWRFENHLINLLQKPITAIVSSNVTIFVVNYGKHPPSVWVSLSGLNSKCVDENSSWIFLLSPGEYLQRIHYFILPCSFHPQATVIITLSMNSRLLDSSHHPLTSSSFCFKRRQPEAVSDSECPNFTLMYEAREKIVFSCTVTHSYFHSEWDDERLWTD